MPSLQRLIGSVSIFLFGLTLIAPIATAQENESSFEKLMAEWTVLDQQLKASEPELAEGDEEAAKAFSKMVDDATVLLEKIKTTVVASIEAGTSDKAMMRAIIGIMINDVYFGRQREAQRVGDRLVAAGVDARYFEAAGKVERLTIPGRELFEELTIRAREAKADDLPRVKLTTSQGEIVLELFENEAPITVGNFVSLVDAKFFDNLKFHRVMEGFMAQTGDPKGDGTGGPGYNIPCECYSPESRRHFFGSISMAHQNARDTGGSQFFLTFDRTIRLDGKHTVFGRIISGMDVLPKLTRTHMLINGQDAPIPDVTPDTIVKAEVIRKRDHEYKPVKVGEEKAAEESPSPTSQPSTDFDAEKEANEESTKDADKENGADKKDDGDQ